MFIKLLFRMRVFFNFGKILILLLVLWLIAVFFLIGTLTTNMYKHISQTAPLRCLASLLPTTQSIFFFPSAFDLRNFLFCMISTYIAFTRYYWRRLPFASLLVGWLVCRLMCWLDGWLFSWSVGRSVIISQEGREVTLLCSIRALI